MRGLSRGWRHRHRDVPSYRVDNMPYGRVKDAGLGREGVHFAMEEMEDIRNLVLDEMAQKFQNL